jgi:hypothetical protein
MYEKGMRLLFKIVSMRDVAVMMCEEPAVSDVKRYSAGSSSHTLSSAMFPSGLKVQEVGAVSVGSGMCSGVMSGEERAGRRRAGWKKAAVVVLGCNARSSLFHERRAGDHARFPLWDSCGGACTSWRMEFLSESVVHIFTIDSLCSIAFQTELLAMIIYQKTVTKVHRTRTCKTLSPLE